MERSADDEWIAGIIAKGQKVYLASDPMKAENLFDPATSGPDGQTLFAREMNQLWKAATHSSALRIAGTWCQEVRERFLAGRRVAVLYSPG